MNNERRTPWQKEAYKPASEVEDPKEIAEKLKYLHESKGEFLSKGVFFDVYTLEMPDDAGETQQKVFKDFRSGDAAMDPKEQVALFQHQYYEYVQLKEMVGKEFFPDSIWIRSESFSDDEAHGFYEKPGVTANTMLEFIKIQLDRQLANRYSSDDKKKGAVKKFMGEVGKRVVPEHAERPFIGAIVQDRINGVSFEKALKDVDESDPAYQLLRDNTRLLIQGLRNYHSENPYGAFTWHGLSSDNVMVELGEDGKITGNVFIIDANFTERPNQTFRQGVIKKIEQQVFEPLEQKLKL